MRALTVRSSESGRTLILAEPVKRGDEVLREPAVAVVPLAPAERCACCLSSMAGITCEPVVSCCSNLVRYCSLECAKLDSMHAAECGRVPHGLSRTDNLLARLTLRLLAAVETSDEPMMPHLARVLPVVSVSMGVATCCSVVVEVRIRPLTSRTAISLLVGPSPGLETSSRLRVLARGLAGGSEEAPGVGVCGRADSGAVEELFATLCRVQCNAFQMYTGGGDGDDDLCEAPGSAMHLFTALTLNHSCAPNVVHCHEADALVVRALEDLPAGAELLTSYVPAELLLQSATARQRSMSRSHGFVCWCSRCSAERAMAVCPLHAACCQRTGCDGAVPLFFGAPGHSSSAASAGDGCNSNDARCVSCGEAASDACVHMAQQVAARTRLALTLRGSITALEAAAAEATAWLHKCHADRVRLLRKLLSALLAAPGGAGGDGADDEAIEGSNGDDADERRSCSAEVARLRSTVKTARALLKVSAGLLPSYHPQLGTLLLTLGNANLHLAMLLQKQGRAPTAVANGTNAATAINGAAAGGTATDAGGVRTTDAVPEATKPLHEAMRFFETACVMLGVCFGRSHPATRRALQMCAMTRRRLGDTHAGTWHGAGASKP